MAWFSKKKKTRARSSRGRAKTWPLKTGRTSRRWDPQRTLLGLKVLGVVLVVTVAWVAWAEAERSLFGYAQEARAEAVDGSGVWLAGAPVWMSEELRAGLRNEAAELIDAEPFALDGLEHAVLRLASSPWVRSVQDVQRISEGRIVIRATYREPVAVVEGPRGYHLVDIDGVRLPGRYARPDLARLGLPLIEGVSLQPKGVGRAWPGDDLSAGLSLLELLQDEPYAAQVTGVDVGGRDTRGRVHLLIKTHGGAVRWGLAPGQEVEVEPGADVKKRRLAGVYRRCGSIDAGGREVELHGAAVYVRNNGPRPLGSLTGYASRR